MSSLFKSIFGVYQLPVAGEQSGQLPVMVWIHGGAFAIGNAIEYQPNRYMEHDIVLVVVQYRLGPLGKPFHSFIYKSFLFRP